VLNEFAKASQPGERCSVSKPGKPCTQRALAITPEGNRHTHNKEARA